MQYQGIEEQRIVNNGLIPIAKDLDMPLVVTNDVHYLRHGDHKPHDILLCIGTGKSVNDEHRLKYHGDQFFLKTAAQMAEVFGDYPEAMQNTLLIAERCNVTIPSGENHLPNFAVPDGFTLDDYFEHVARQGYAQRMERLRQLEAEGQAAAHARAVRRASRLRDRDDQEDGVSRVLHDRLGLHPLRARAGHSGRSGPRLGRRQPGRVGAADHRRRSAATTT